MAVRLSLEDKVRTCREKAMMGEPGLRYTGKNVYKAEGHLKKADHNLEAMEDFNKLGKYGDWVISAGYYAMYHSVMAILFMLGFEGQTHECALAALEYFCVQGKIQLGDIHLESLKKARKLEAAFVESVQTAKRERVNTQYGIETTFKTSEVDTVRNQAKAFVTRAKELVKELK